MRVVDSRRVTGSNLYTRESGALVDLAFDASDPEPDALVEAWQRAIVRVLPWRAETFARPYKNGVALFVTGPLDALYPLTDLNEWAVWAAEAELRGREPAAIDPRIFDEIEDSHVPGLVELIAAARSHDMPLLVDDDAITLGTGPAQLRFDRRGPLPPPAEIDWDALAMTRIPIGIVTGTNGKTTTTRLAARMVREAGKVPGLTSSDGVAVGDEVIRRGDFSGPEGTRLVLRDPRVEVAILETARGGILRRGLTVERCDAAVITNVSGDHLGDYGIDDVATMARVKAVVARDARTVILNADDVSLAPMIRTFGDRVVTFSRTSYSHWRERDGFILRGAHPLYQKQLVAVADIPITFGGRAAYNIENALAAAALASTLGIPDEAIVAGLRSFTSTSEDNPGRGNVVDVGGVTLLLDFGHNPAAIRAVLGLARSLLAERTGGAALRVTIGMPGDRLDDELREVAAEIAAGHPALVIVRELSHDLLRGRAVGEVPAIIARELGKRRIATQLADTELDAAKRLLAASQPGDLVLVLTHLDPAVRALAS